MSLKCSSVNHLKYPHISLSMKRFLFNCRKNLSRTLSLIMAPTTIRPHFFKFTSKQILMERSFCRPVPIYRSSIPGYFRFAGNVVLYFSHHFINTEGRIFLSRERYRGHEMLNVHPLYDWLMRFIRNRCTYNRPGQFKRIPYGTSLRDKYIHTYCNLELAIVQLQLIPC